LRHDQLVGLQRDADQLVAMLRTSRLANSGVVIELVELRLGSGIVERTTKSTPGSVSISR
jgi:hypothetical protein